MKTGTIRRRLAGAFVALALAAAGVFVGGSPAAASVSYSFSGPTVTSGTVTFINSYTVRVTATVPGDDFGPGYLAEGVWFGGVGRYRCVSVSHRNYRIFHYITYVDTLECDYANIQQAAIIYLPGYGIEYIDYFDNPYA